MDRDTLRYWVSVGFRRLPVVVATTLACAFAGIALITLLPPIYRAVATIILQPPQIAQDLARPTVPSDTLAQVASIQGEVLARDNLLALANRFDIYEGSATQSDAEIIEDLRQRIRIEFLKVGGTPGVDGAATFTVAFHDGDPARTVAVVNHLVSVILDKSFMSRAERAGETLAFFNREVASLAAATSKAEADILRFKNEHIGALPDSLEFRYTQRSSAQERLVLLEREEAGLRSRRETLLTTGMAADLPAASAADQELSTLRRLLEERLAVFAPTSQSVLDVKQRIEALERPAPSATLADGGELPGVFRVQLAEIDGRLKFIEREKKDIAALLRGLEDSIRDTPANETELNRLMRVYESTNARYLAAIQGRADAAVGAQIEARLKGERLRLLEEPVLPEKPVRPQRLKIMLASLVAGIGLGCAIILLLELLDGRVRRPAQLVHRIGLEPLATIPSIDLPREQSARRRRALGVGTALGASAGVLAAIVHFAVMPLGDAALRILHAMGLPLAG